MKLPVDGFEVTPPSHPESTTDQGTRNLTFNKHIDNLTPHDDTIIGSRVLATDDIHKYPSVTDGASLPRNKSSQSYEPHDSSDNEDDEVNDLFKQLRRMSNRSGSHSSNSTSRRSNNEKTKCGNPFLEPFHRHSSVDMKGKKESF